MNTPSGRFSLGVCCDLFLNEQEIFGGCVDLIGTQLDLKSTPLAVRQFDDGIDFSAVIILIVIERTTEGLSIDF